MDRQEGLIVLVPYEFGQEYWGRDPSYLPVYVATQDEDLALMAVGFQACVNSRYVTFSSWETEDQWQQRDYPGTLEAPGVGLPATEEAYEIPEPGDCFCCPGLAEFQVLTPEAMIKRLQSDPNAFMLEDMITSQREREDLWEQFHQWIKKYLGDISIAECEPERLSVSKAIDLVKENMDRVHELVDTILQSLQEDSDETESPELKGLQRDGKKLQRQLGRWLNQVLDYVTTSDSEEELEPEETTEEAETLSLAEAIDSLREPILDAINRGYTLSEIAEMLTEGGMEIDAPTLQHYLSQ